jgi:hypothetical protein
VTCTCTVHIPPPLQCLGQKTRFLCQFQDFSHSTMFMNTYPVHGKTISKLVQSPQRSKIVISRLVICLIVYLWFFTLTAEIRTLFTRFCLNHLFLCLWREAFYCLIYRRTCFAFEIFYVNIPTNSTFYTVWTAFSFSNTVVYTWSLHPSFLLKVYGWSSLWGLWLLFNPILPGSSSKAWRRPLFNTFQAPRVSIWSFKLLPLFRYII